MTCYSGREQIELKEKLITTYEGLLVDDHIIQIQSTFFDDYSKGYMVPILISYALEKEGIYSEEEVLNLNYDFFEKYKLTLILKDKFRNDFIKAFQVVFPKIKTFEFYNKPENFWKNNYRNGLLYFIKKEGLSDEELLSLTPEWFTKNNINPILNYFEGDLIKTIRSVYPDLTEFKFQNYDPNTFSKETSELAISILLSKEQLNSEQLLSLDLNWFRANSLEPTLKYFNNSPRQAILHSYTKFKKRIYKNVPTIHKRTALQKRKLFKLALMLNIEEIEWTSEIENKLSSL